ncbi:hypothetical protein FACS1894186_5980 [Alphaproteobacteria bacterium]|nr:hypothetical protein FACS1894186_5980 [Alphaproteobacteria bacterium]
MKHASIGIAAAVAVLAVGGQALAESSLTIGKVKVAKVDQGTVDASIYGKVSAGIRYSDWNTGNDSPRFGLDSGVGGESRLGTKVSVGLPEGFKAGAIFEAGLDIDTGADKTPFWNRQALAFVSHKEYGAISAGRMATPQYNLVGKFDPYADSYDGKMTANYLYDARASNMLSYESPKWDGFAFTVAGTLNAKANEGSNNADKEPEVLLASFAPTYTSGGLSLGLNASYARQRDNVTLSNNSELFIGDAMASYDFGAAKLHGAIGTREVKGATGYDFLAFNNTAGQGKAIGTTYQWMGGITVPVSENGAVMGVYTGRNTKAVAGDDTARTHMFSVGYRHAVNEYLTAFGTVSYAHNNDKAREAPAAVTKVRANVAGGTDYQTGGTVGIALSF